MPRPRRRWTQVKSRSRKPKAAQDDGWFSIRGILDERPVEGGVEYLVDWDDNPNTGDAYDPTWSREVTDEAREEWEREKASTARRGAPEGDGQPALLDGCRQNGPLRLLNQSPTPTADAGPPILSRSPGSEDLNDRPRKVARLRRSDASSEEPVPSIASLPSVDPVATPVIGNQSLPLDVGTDSCLKIPLDDEESPIDEIECLGTASTQSSHLSSLSVAEQEAQDDIVTFSSQISRRTIPDSQEPSGQSWSKSGPSPTSSQPLACSQEALVGGSDESQSRQVAADIPSRQPAADSESLRVEGRNLTTATASDSDTIRSPGQIDQPPAPASSNEPIFQTQPPARRVSSIPESASESRASNHTSPSEIRATPTDPFADSILLSRVEAEPPDAQIVRRHDFDPLRDILMMESHSADAAPSEPQISASDELSQLLNLGPTLPGPDSPPPQVEGHGLFVGAAASMPMAPPASPPSAVEALQRIVDDAFAPSNVAPPESRISIEPRHVEQPTVSPADITHQDGPRKGPLILLQSPLHHDLILSGLPGASAGPASMAQPHAARAPSEASVRSASGPAELEHVVTLPFQASLRPLYDETLLGDKRAVTEFGRIFNSKVPVAPDEALVKKIDHLFSRLHNICDYPQHVVATSLEALPPMQMAKYSCDANPKFNFLYELLQSIKRNTKMLIVARSVELLRLIYTLTEALEVDCVCDAVGKSKSSFTNSVASVRLILPDVDVGAFDADVVIGFDHSFASSRARSIYSDDDRTYSPGPSLAPEGRPVGRPLVLILATIHSIEHIDLSVPADLGRLERKNALLAGIVHARKLMSDPDRGYLEPHEVARCFAEYINGEVEDVAWKPVAVPDEVLDVYDGSQTRPHMTIAASPDVDKGRKRKLQDDVQDEDAKKIRLLQIQESTVETNEPPLSDDIQEMLQRFMPQESAENPMQARTKVPVVMLQALTEKLAELERQLAAKDAEAEYKAVIAAQETRIKEYEGSTEKIYKAHRQALEDRSHFESDCKKLQGMLESAKGHGQRDKERADGRIAELEATVVRLTADASGSAEETPLAKSEQLLRAAEDKVQMLQKRLENAQNEASYSRSMYQEASTSATTTRAENNELRQTLEDLEKKSSDNLVRVHQIQAENESGQLLAQIRQMKQLIGDREAELDRVREDLRQLRNGRRETRQSSVPRSPRTSMMSPRSGRAYGGSASRGTSPAPMTGQDGPGTQYLSVQQQQSNGRWNHLRG